MLLCSHSMKAKTYNSISRARLALNHQNITRSARLDINTDSLYIPVVLEITDDSAVDSLMALGAVIFRQRERFVVACIPESKAMGLDSVRYILSGAVSNKCSINNDRSREFSNVAPVHLGNDGNIGFDGSNVVTGFCDIGFAPGHIAFKGRVPKMVNYDMRHAKRYEYNADNLPVTDNANEFHASHVANIMAGSREHNPYYGYAPASTLIATTSDLYDGAFLCGIEDIIDYAKANDKPAVVNLSVGNQLGPRDGTDVINRYLDLLGKEAIICFSAGNSGDSKISLTHTFESGDDVLSTLFDTYATWDGMHVVGETDIWSADSSQFEVAIMIFDFDKQEYVYQSPWYSGRFTVDLSEGNHAIPLEMYSKNQIVISGDIDHTNGRYNVAIVYDMKSTGMRQAGPWSRYYFGMRLRARNGVSIDANTDGSLSFMMSSGKDDVVNGDGSMSISNYACGHNVISVGSYNSRNTLPLVTGGEKTFNFNVGDATSWSGYGTLRDGRVMPDISAPGNYVISATGKPFYENNPDVFPISYQVTLDGETHRWHGECGTSMSSPAVAGIFALWLQADPTLDRDRILDIAQKTARRDMNDLNNPRWGSGGAIDAYAGLKEVLARLSVGTVSQDIIPLIQVVNRKIEVVVPDGIQHELSVCDLSGRNIDPQNQLSPGVYIVNISAGSRSIVQKILIQ